VPPESKSPRPAEAGLPDVLYLDLGGVLVRNPRLVMVDLLELAEGRALPGLSDGYLRLSERLDRNEIELTEMHRNLSARYRLTIEYAAFSRMVRDESLELYPRATELVRRIRATRRIRTAVLSNTSAAVWEALVRKFSIDRLFDARVLSYEVGALKPEPAIYAEALARAQVRPEASRFLDDLAENVAAARQAGIRAVHVPKPEDTERELTQLLAQLS
jgi:glucose-1-phosphatase